MAHDSEPQRRRLSPVLSDEPLVGERLTRRLRIVLISVALAFVLTNASSYLIGQAVRAEAERDNRARIANIEREFAADLEERRKQRDAETARQDGELRQLRAELCTLGDRAQPRDAEVQQLRQRFGCTGNPRTAAGSPPPSPQPGRTPSGGRTGGQGENRPDAGSPSRPGGGSSRPPAPPRPSPTPKPPPPPPQEPDDDGLICLPILGCIL